MGPIRFINELKRGSRGYDVEDWQRGLHREGFLTPGGSTIVDDGVFGKDSEYATKSFQASCGLPQSGIVDAATEHEMFSTALALGLKNWDLEIAEVISKNFTPGNRRAIDLLVIHCMEWPDKPDGAEQVAAWFAGPKAPQASAHYCCDSNSIVRTVREKDVAWHAPGANGNGIGVELTGYAKWTAEKWKTNKVLDIAAPLFADLCLRYQIHPTFLDAAALKRHERGITTHAEVTKAFGHGGHWDPGPGFPLQEFLFNIGALVARGSV